MVAIVHTGLRCSPEAEHDLGFDMSGSIPAAPGSGFGMRCAAIGEGNGVIAWTAQTDAGYAFDTCGANRREPVDFDGLPLVAFKPN